MGSNFEGLAIAFFPVKTYFELGRWFQLQTFQSFEIGESTMTLVLLPFYAFAGREKVGENHFYVRNSPI